jgi:hypothetical protein
MCVISRRTHTPHATHTQALTITRHHRTLHAHPTTACTRDPNAPSPPVDDDERSSVRDIGIDVDDDDDGGDDDADAGSGCACCCRSSCTGGVSTREIEFLRSICARTESNHITHIRVYTQHNTQHTHLDRATRRLRRGRSRWRDVGAERLERIGGVFSG